MPMHSEAPFPFDNSYAKLPGRFFERQAPTPVSAPNLIRMNPALAQHLGVDGEWLNSREGVEVIAGNRVPPGAEPIATAYAGHQFGGWNPQLGDGRAILLGEVVAADQVRYDIQLKGAGRTAYSRGGDGRAPLGPVLREYMVSEAMAALGIATSRTLAAVTTGDSVMRGSIEPSGVLARVAQSHIRIGTFEFFAGRGDEEGLRLLADHVIARHYPEAADADNPQRAMLDAVITRQAELIASWQLIGFIHGVMNTDNVLLSGETIDYGPCAFMDIYHPDTVFSSIDHGGRYAYGNQPRVGHWNLGRLAQALLPLLHKEHSSAVDSGQEAIDGFPDQFAAAYRRGMGKKLGMAECTAEDDALFDDLLELMKQEETDFTLTFRHLSDLACPPDTPENSVRDLFPLTDAFTPWLQRWRQRIGLNAEQPSPGTEEAIRSMHSVNPAIIPRNHKVQEAITAGVDEQDLAPFHDLVSILAQPYTYDATRAPYAVPPRPEQIVEHTFCGT